MAHTIEHLQEQELERRRRTLEAVKGRPTGSQEVGLPKPPQAATPTRAETEQARADRLTNEVIRGKQLDKSDLQWLLDFNQRGAKK